MVRCRRDGASQWHALYLTRKYIAKVNSDLAQELRRRVSHRFHRPTSVHAADRCQILWYSPRTNTRTAGRIRSTRDSGGQFLLSSGGRTIRVVQRTRNFLEHRYA